MKRYLGRALYPAMLPEDATIWKHDITNDEARNLIVDGLTPYVVAGDRYILRWVEELFDVTLPQVRQPHEITLKPGDQILVPKGATKKLTFSVFEVMDFEVR